MAEIKSRDVGWQHDPAVLPPLPPVSVSAALPGGWQHGAPSMEAWGFAQAWALQMAGGYAVAGPPPVQYFATQQQSPAGLPMAHQGGVIFLCDPRTEGECLQRGLFGLPATQTQIVRAIVPEATLLFLFNVRDLGAEPPCLQ